jgi:hypothetical protein
MVMCKQNMPLQLEYSAWVAMDGAAIECNLNLQLETAIYLPALRGQHAHLCMPNTRQMSAATKERDSSLALSTDKRLSTFARPPQEAKYRILIDPVA